MALIPPQPLVWSAWARFIPFFFLRSLMGGVDVARRAFHPHLPIRPALIEYPLQLPPGLAQIVMANTVSILPGTLSTELGQNILTIHVLDSDKDFNTELATIEQYIERIFGLCRDEDR